jgi:hypothetical protein
VSLSTELAPCQNDKTILQVTGGSWQKLRMMGYCSSLVVLSESITLADLTEH